MKRIVAAAVVLFLLTGCGKQETVYTESCAVCRDDVDRFIRTVYEDYVCASCFWIERWQICNGCGLAYNPDEFNCADGYCSGCAEEETWYCSKCETRHALEHLLDLGNGFSLCPECAAPYLLESDPDIPQKIERSSPFVPKE